MLKRLGLHLDDMVVAVLIWLCTLPLVGLFIVPFFGLRVGLAVAAGLFLIALAICWGICGWKIFRTCSAGASVTAFGGSQRQMRGC